MCIVLSPPVAAVKVRVDETSLCDMPFQLCDRMAYHRWVIYERELYFTGIIVKVIIKPSFISRYNIKIYYNGIILSEVSVTYLPNQRICTRHT